MALDKTFFEDLEARIPKGKVRTRFAPSPTGYMHVGNLRTALYTWLIARHAGGTFILRIEDTDQGRLVEGATDVIYRTMKECHLDHDEGPDVGGPTGPYIQSERRDLYLPYAQLLVEKGAAYYCFCEKAESEEDSGEFDRADDPCRNLSEEEAAANLAAGKPYVIRQRIPHEGTTTFHDVSFGDITVENKTLDDQVLLKRDGLPTYNFANVVDDHLMGITHVVRGSEYLSSAPKYNLLYEAFGWEVPTYVHCSPVMRDQHNKMSKRHGDPSYEDLKAQGFDVEFQVAVPAECGIRNADMVVAFGNLLDNAAEACRNAGEKRIALSAGMERGYLHIREQNPAPVGPVSHDRRIPELERGIGHHILRELAERYDGSFTCHVEHNEFLVDLFLREPEM